MRLGGERSWSTMTDGLAALDVDTREVQVC